MTDLPETKPVGDVRANDRFGTLLLGWWKRDIADRNAGQARATSARLRRAQGPAAVLGERAVHDLLDLVRRDDGIPPAMKRRLREPRALARMAVVLAELREHHRHPLPRRLGGEDPVMSELRFRRMLSAEDDELAAALRRAATMADRKCDVPALARDLLWWGEAERIRWCFQYYGTEPPAAQDDAPPTHEGDDAP